MGAFNSLLSKEATGYERNKATVEIGGETVTLYAKPMTAADMDQLLRKHSKFIESPTLAATVDLIIAKTETEAGDRAFDMEDKPYLMKMSLTKLNKLRADLFPDDQGAIDDEAIRVEEKN